jgi:hypothetical protein
MTPSPNNKTPGRRNLRRYLILVGLFIVLIAGAVIFFRRPPRGPKLLNQQTKAREARPFTTKPDPRFDPLPFEPEKHGK